MLWPEDFQFGLTKFSIGIWRSRGHYSLSVMVNKHCDKFVVLVDLSKLEKKAKKTAQLYHNIASNTASFFNGSFPFSRENNKQSVLAFEIEWADIVGIDYRNPLCEDGRLVLEARKVTKREFGSVNDVQMFYMMTPPSSPIRSTPKLQSLRDAPHSAAPDPLGRYHSPFLSPATKQQPQDSGWLRRRCSSELKERKGAGSSPKGAPLSPNANALLLSDHPLQADRQLEPIGAALRFRSQHTAGAPRSRSTEEMGDLGVTAMRRLEKDLRSHAVDSGAPDGSPPKKMAGSMPTIRSAPISLPKFAGSRRLDLSETDLCSLSGGESEGEAGTKSLRSGSWKVDETGKFHFHVSHQSSPGMPTGSWPPPARWTAAAEVFSNRTVVLNFTNPVLPLALESVFGGDKRLLRLYESGLPSWAIFLPAYGMWYRPWMRKVTLYLFILISLVSLALGFYDLYKNVPFFQTMLKNLVGNMYLPIFDWLEEHTKVRLSIFLTYLFGKSEFFLPVMQLLSRFVGCIRTLLAPVTNLVSQLILPIWKSAAAAVVGLGSLVGGPASQAIKAVKSIAVMFWNLLVLVGKILEPVAKGVTALVVEPLTLLSQGLRGVMSLLGASLSVIRQCFAFLAPAWRSWVPALKQGAAAASQATRAAKPAASAVAAAGFNANYWKTLIVKVANAVKSIANFAIYCACTLDRHRKSMAISAWQSWSKLKAKVMRRVEPHLAVLVALVPYLVAAWYLFTGLNLIPGPDRSNLSSGLAEDATQEAKGATADVAAAIEVSTSPDDSSPEEGSYRNETTTQVDPPDDTMKSEHESTSVDDMAEASVQARLMFRSKSMSPRIPNSRISWKHP